jgi:hypothetical protein
MTLRHRQTFPGFGFGPGSFPSFGAALGNLPSTTPFFLSTGMWPFNPDAITPDMMAPSKPTAMASSLPVVPATPVRVVGGMLQELAGLLVEDDLDDVGDGNDEDDWVGIEEVNPFHDGEEGEDDRAEEGDDGGEEWEEWGGIIDDESEDDGGGAEGPVTTAGPASAEECIRTAVKKLKASALKHLISSFPIVNAIPPAGFPPLSACHSQTMPTRPCQNSKSRRIHCPLWPCHTQMEFTLSTMPVINTELSTSYPHPCTRCFNWCYGKLAAVLKLSCLEASGLIQEKIFWLRKNLYTMLGL